MSNAECVRRYQNSPKGKAVKAAYRAARKAEMAAYQKEYYDRPIAKFLKHRDGALKRGVPFLMTFAEWWKVWQDSGKWEQRGRAKDQYAMCRTNDTGPYQVGNVRIDTASNNMKEHHAIMREVRKTS